METCGRPYQPVRLRPISVLRDSGIRRVWLEHNLNFNLRGGVLMSVGGFPESLSQAILAGRISVGSLGLPLYIYIYIYIYVYIYIYICIHYDYIYI